MNKQTFILDNKFKVQQIIDRLYLVNPGSDQPTYQLTIDEYKTTRSSAQNRLYWMWLKIIADHVTHHDTSGTLFSDNDMHDWLREKFLDTRLIEVRGEFVKSRKSTTKLNTKEFTDYLEKIDMFCAQTLNLVLPHPEDLYYSAMGIK